MNKTGAKQAGSTHPGRYMPWNEPLSRPILRTYSAEVTSPGEQSPASSQCALLQALDYCTTYSHGKSRRFLPISQSFFTVLGHLSRKAYVQLHQQRKRASPPIPERPVSHCLFSTLRPNKPYAWQACRSRRTRRPASPARRGCTGRIPRPPPSSSPRRPRRRTTWSWRSRPESPFSP